MYKYNSLIFICYFLQDAPPESILGQLMKKVTLPADYDSAFRLLNTGHYGAIGNEIQLDSVHQQTFTEVGWIVHTRGLGGLGRFYTRGHGLVRFYSRGLGGVGFFYTRGFGGLGRFYAGDLVGLGRFYTRRLGG